MSQWTVISVDFSCEKVGIHHGDMLDIAKNDNFFVGNVLLRGFQTNFFSSFLQIIRSFN